MLAGPFRALAAPPNRTSRQGGGSKRPLGCVLFGDCLLFHFLAFLPSALWPLERPGRFS